MHAVLTQRRLIAAASLLLLDFFLVGVPAPELDPLSVSMRLSTLPPFSIKTLPPSLTSAISWWKVVPP
jgi:hypothetical protein